MCQSTCLSPVVRERHQQQQQQKSQHEPVPHQRGHVVEQLPNDYTPTNWDVICGRSKSYYHHVGNRNFRQLAASKIGEYLLAKTKIDKGYVIVSILEAIQEQGGTFVRPDPRTLGGWWIVNDATAREKIGSTIRAIVRTMGGEDVVLAKLRKQDKKKTRHDDRPAFNEATSQTISNDHQVQDDELTLSTESISTDTAEPISYSSAIGTHDHDELLLNHDDFFEILTTYPFETDLSLIHMTHQNLHEDPFFDWIPSSIVSVPPNRRESLSLAAPPSDDSTEEEQPFRWVSLDFDLDQSELNLLLNGVDIVTEFETRKDGQW